MTNTIEFTKLSGSGNDFICISNMDGRYDQMLASSREIGHFAKTLCRSRIWVGADGVIFASRSEIEEKAHFSARFFEADGSEAELSGNGTACFVRWVIESGLSPNMEIRILTPAGVVLGRDVGNGFYRVCIPLPRDTQRDIEIDVQGRQFTCDFTIAGVPHAVVYVEDINKIDIETLGPAIRFHPRFGPRGVNVNFVQVLGNGELAIRTWEFGVEGETLACGTGSAAASVLATLRLGWPESLTTATEPIIVHARSGDSLRVYVGMDDNRQINDLCLDTLVRPVFTGTLSPTLTREATTVGNSADSPAMTGTDPAK